MQQSFELPELDRKKTQRAVEAALEKYRIFKTMPFEEKEATITAGYQERFHGPTNVTSDQTAEIAIYNTFIPAMRKEYCEKVERSVNKLYPRERLLITERYMKDELMTDLKMYSFVFNPPISKDTYAKIRWMAFYSLAFNFDYYRIVNITELVKTRTSE
ncbi:hypothetical protein J31TS4_18650 [Paenibacillus sp. J31TS4]|uniref:ArpU family phage packaging/lysis transcriptional regulator n=1 Tax=Paenibacillus sp. J31TS4 TaxID=2807195 RepID=UPI001B0D1B24|nr:ArpU family phage packaging/lysis transcriptional regulator [Paenibacillus sp. J31TS4]GIP38585.1 hypothetical protein J31TS4_18650 [Paenibacillus sp. J31TS4]